MNIMTVGFTESLHSIVVMHPVSSRHDLMFYTSILILLIQFYTTLQLRLTYIPVVGAKEHTCQRKKWAVLLAMYYLHLLLGCSLLLCSTAAFEKQHRRGEHWEFLVPSPWQVYEVWRWSKVSLWGIRAAWARTGEAAPFIEGCCASLLWYATLARGKQIKK